LNIVLAAFRVGVFSEDEMRRPTPHTMLDGRMEDEDLSGMEKAVEVREALERVQTLSLETSEDLDACQTRHGG
jgi:hypothetical protein